jgi:hypothetical protein
MSDLKTQPGDELAPASREEILSALFANMVIQQTNMAMMLLGKVAHPETGKFMHDVEAAKMFIDQLEMLEAKTKGNLTREEDSLMKQALTALRMSFVEAIDGPAPAAETPPAPAQPADPAASTSAAAPQPAAPPIEAAPAQDESRKKFSKKY